MKVESQFVLSFDWTQGLDLNPGDKVTLAAGNERGDIEIQVLSVWGVGGLVDSMRDFSNGRPDRTPTMSCRTQMMKTWKRTRRKYNKVTYTPQQTQDGLGREEEKPL
jgi:hypothetical protein